MAKINNHIGALDRFVQIVRFVESVSDTNSPRRTQETVKEVWAGVSFKTAGGNSQSSAEKFDEKVIDINKRDYIVHYDIDIVAEHIQDLAVVDEGKTYYVTGFNPEYQGRGMYILLNCKYHG